jgi:hypothetical protein
MIRPATLGDIPALLEMGKAFHAESGWSKLAGYCEDSWRETLEGALPNDAWRCFVWDDDGAQGFIIGLMLPLYFNRSVVTAHELLWWVRPEHRKGAGGELLRAFHRNADLGVQTVSETTPRNEAVKRRLRIDGWQPIEQTFIKRIR